jgi:hypothetical protein
MERDLLKQVNATPAQMKRIEPFLAHEIKEMEALRPQSKPGSPPPPRPDFRTLMPKFQAIRAEFDGKLSKVLSKDQFKKYSDLRAQMRARRGRGGFGRPGGPPGGPGGPGGGRG